MDGQCGSCARLMAADDRFCGACGYAHPDADATSTGRSDPPAAVGRRVRHYTLQAWISGLSVPLFWSLGLHVASVYLFVSMAMVVVTVRAVIVRRDLRRGGSWALCSVGEAAQGRPEVVFWFQGKEMGAPSLAGEPLRTAFCPSCGTPAAMRHRVPTHPEAAS